MIEKIKKGAVMLIKRTVFWVSLVTVTSFVVPQPDPRSNHLKQIPADIPVAKELIKNVMNTKRRPYTQSEANIILPEVQQYLVKEEAGLFHSQGIIEKYLAREREMSKNYYIVCTAVPHGQLFQDVVRKLYKRAHGNIGALKDKSFQFLRYNIEDPAYAKYEDAQEFLTEQIEAAGIIDDNEKDLKKILLSVNFALFGNSGLTGESTWFYLNNPQPWAEAQPEWLQEAISSFKFPLDYTKRLLALAPLVKSNQGDLFQICIPKNLVDKVGYLSWRQGIPFDKELLEELFPQKKKEPVSVLTRGAHVTHHEIKEAVYRIKRGYKAGDGSMKELAANLKANIDSGAYKLSTNLYKYRNDPLALWGPNYWQARLLISKNYLLNPNSGIKIFRYSQVLDPEKERMYKAELKKILREMEADQVRRTQGVYVPYNKR